MPMNSQTDAAASVFAASPPVDAPARARPAVDSRTLARAPHPLAAAFPLAPDAPLSRPIDLAHAFFLPPANSAPAVPAPTATEPATARADRTVVPPAQAHHLRRRAPKELWQEPALARPR